MSKFLVKLFMLKTRLIVNTYTVTTLPFYYIIQKPWKTLELAKQMRSKKFESINGEIIWTRNDTITTHPFLECDTYVQVLQDLNNKYEPNREMLGQREVIHEMVQKDEKGQVIKVEGKVLRKFTLSESYKWLTLKEVIDKVDNIAKGLVQFGIKKGDKVIIFADTRLEWFLCSLAIMKVNATLTTLFSNLGTPGLIFGLNQTEAKTIITTFDLLPKLNSFISQVPNISSIIYIKNKNDVYSQNFPQNISIKSLEQIETLGKESNISNQFELPKVDDIAVIMYTSGTTGIPKAVCISHKQLMASLRVLLSNTKNLAHEAERHVYISFLPLAHILGFTFELFLFFGGVKIGYSSPFTLVDSSPGLAKGQISDIKLVRPTSMTTVPLVLDRVLKEIYDKLKSRSPLLTPLFIYLMDYKIYWTQKGYDTPIINKIICKKVGEAMGGNLEYVIVGGAPLNDRTQALVKAALNVKLTQGYGATETCGGVLGMHLDDLSYGRIGVPLDGVNVKLIDWVEGGYCVSDKPNPRGEIVIGSDIVAEGYYKLSEETNEAFSVDENGVRWFHTGDIGEVYPDGTFKIIDRRKDLVKLQNGEYISLGKVEAALKSCHYVDNLCVCGGTFSNDLIAIITLNQKKLSKLSDNLGKKGVPFDQLCDDTDIYKRVYKSLVKAGISANLSKKEIPSRIKLVCDEWTPDNDMLTAAMKLKRKSVQNKYKNVINDLFQIQK